MAGGSPIARAMGQIEQQSNEVMQTPGYTAPPPSNPYQSAYSPFGGIYQPAFTPTPQQQQTLDPYSQSGLGALYAQMMGQYLNPPSASFVPFQQYSSPALQYRPDLTQAQESLRRVYTPPAYDAVNPETGQPTYDYGGGGGGDGGGDGGGGGGGDRAGGLLSIDRKNRAKPKYKK